MYKLHLSPLASSYAATPGSGVITTDLAGGRPRYRRDFIGSNALVNCEWKLTGDEILFMHSFRRTMMEANPSSPFLVDLILDGDITEEYQANFVPGTFSITGIHGLTQYVQAQLSVIPVEHDEQIDSMQLAAYALFGRYDITTSEDLLDQLINEDVPSIGL